mgnify:CR=1 FL=1
MFVPVEMCTYCKINFSVPVELHHDQEECDVNERIEQIYFFECGQCEFRIEAPKSELHTPAGVHMEEHDKESLNG